MSFIGVTLVNKIIYGFQVSISVLHDLYITLRAHHPKSDHLLSLYTGPIYFFLTPWPFPLVTTIL